MWPTYKSLLEDALLDPSDHGLILRALNSFPFCGAFVGAAVGYVVDTAFKPPSPPFSTNFPLYFLAACYLPLLALTVYGSQRHWRTATEVQMALFPLVMIYYMSDFFSRINHLQYDQHRHEWTMLCVIIGQTCVYIYLAIFVLDEELLLEDKDTYTTRCDWYCHRQTIRLFLSEPLVTQLAVLLHPSFHMRDRGFLQVWQRAQMLAVKQRLLSCLFVPDLASIVSDYQKPVP